MHKGEEECKEIEEECKEIEEECKEIEEKCKEVKEIRKGKEEECMERYNCPIASTNKTAHTTFLDMFNKYYEEYQKKGGSNDLAIKIHETLSDWFVNHVSGIDAKLHPCIHPK